MLEKYRSIVCWVNLWIALFLIGSAKVYSLTHQVKFVEILDNNYMDLSIPDPTIALLLSMGVTLLAMSNFYLIFHYIHVLSIILVRKPIRV